MVLLESLKIEMGEPVKVFAKGVDDKIYSLENFKRIQGACYCFYV